jgi:hypothetical protein
VASQHDLTQFSLSVHRCPPVLEETAIGDAKVGYDGFRSKAYTDLADSWWRSYQKVYGHVGVDVGMPAFSGRVPPSSK